DFVVAHRELLDVARAEGGVHETTAVALRLAPAHVVDYHGAHRLGRVGEEVLGVVDTQIPGALQPQERLVYQRGGVEEREVPAACEARARQTTQLTVEHRQIVGDYTRVFAGRIRLGFDNGLVHHIAPRALKAAHSRDCAAPCHRIERGMSAFDR